MTTSKKLAEMKSLAKQGNESLFDRLKLADEVLADTQYVDQHFGSDSKAIDALQADYFSMVGGLITLGRMLAIYREFRDQSIWRKYRYDLAALNDLMPSDKPEPKPRNDWRSMYEELLERFRQVEAELSQQKLDNAELRVKLAHFAVDKLQAV